MKKGSDIIPYIKKENRKWIDANLDKLIDWLPEISDETVGDYTYIVYKLLSKAVYKKKYYKYALVLGVLESAKIEFYRRQIAKYENKKIKENGDVE